MIFWTIFLLHGAWLTGSQPNGSAGTPENITVHVLDPKTVQVFWSSVWNNVERFDVTYNPTEDKIVSQAAGNSQSIVLRELRPDTQYQVTITAVINGKNYKSRRIVFRTAPDPSIQSSIQQLPTQPPDGKGTTAEYVTVDPTAKYMPQTSSTVRGVELGLVLLALVVWIVAIALFFHRWGKIRMLLPYQPDYKTQQALKVPGTGTTMGTSSAGNTGTQGQQDGPGCVQHLRWSSNCYDEKSTAKKSKWTARTPPATVQPLSSMYQIRSPVHREYTASPEVITHPYPQKNGSIESIAMCQLNQPRSDSPEVTLNAPTRTKFENGTRREYVKLRDAEVDSEYRQRKYVSSLENISDSIQNILRCASVYSFCQSKRPQDDYKRGRRKYEATKAELEPLFFVGEKELYCNNEEDTKIVVHHCPSGKPEKEILPSETKPKRYSKTSLKKQKVSLYDERELDLYMRVPIVQRKTEEPETKRKVQRDSAEMKRKTFLRKISLQDTYLNYNQDYWLDFKKSVRFHKSIDLGYFGNEDGKMTKSDSGEKPKQRLSERITEKSAESPDEDETQSRQSAVPCYRRKTYSESENHNRGSVVMEDFRKDSGGSSKTWFLLPSNENIPLFSERNGHIETDFDLLSPEQEECLLIEKSDPRKELRFRFEEESDTSSEPSEEIAFPTETQFDISQFYEIKLNNGENPVSGEQPVRRSTVFDFQGGHAFFGENRTSTSEESDVFCNEIDPGIDSAERTNQGYSGRMLFVAGSEMSRNSGIV